MDHYAVAINRDGVVSVGAVHLRGKKGLEVEVHLAAFVGGGLWPWPMEWHWIPNGDLYLSCESALLRAANLSRARALRLYELGDQFEALARVEVGDADRYIDREVV